MSQVMKMRGSLRRPHGRSFGGDDEKCALKRSKLRNKKSHLLNDILCVFQSLFSFLHSYRLIIQTGVLNLVARSAQTRIQLTHRIMRASLSTQSIAHHNMTSPGSRTQALHR